MLVLLSPAKSLDLTSDYPDVQTTKPRLLDRSNELVELLVAKSPAELAKTLGVSEQLATTAAGYYQDFTTPFINKDNARPAIFTFNGDVYQGFDAASIDKDNLDYAQRVVRSLSGLYGVLRPLDLIQPYRLDMGTKLQTERGKDLYEFWGAEPTELINKDTADSPGEKVVINLVSNEYFEAIKVDQLENPLVNVRFEEIREGGARKVISFHAKKARGLMARWIVDEHIEKSDDLVGFDVEGYGYDDEASTDEQLVFVRDGRK